jgi:hypothetical protein
MRYTDEQVEMAMRCIRDSAIELDEVRIRPAAIAVLEAVGTHRDVESAVVCLRHHLPKCHATTARYAALSILNNLFPR